MNISILGSRISECIDDLGLLLDLIYKFPQKQRENYFDRIQGMKNKLLSLKGNIRQSNCSAIEKQYKQLYLCTNSLKSQLQQHIALLPSVKQNREVNRYKEFKDTRKNYQESMKILIAKDEEIKGLNELLFEKEEIFRLNYQELRKTKEELQIVIENQRISKMEHNQYEDQLQRAKGYIIRLEQDLFDFKIRQEEKDKAFNDAIVELEQIKLELIASNERVFSLEHLLQIKNAKEKISEETNRKSDRFEIVRENNVRQQDSFRKLREVSELQYQLGIKHQALKQIEQQKKHLKEDIQVLQNETNKLKEKIAQIKELSLRQKEDLLSEQKKLIREIENSKNRESELKNILEQAEKKHMTTINKLNAAEQFKVKLRESEFQNELLVEKVCGLEVYIQKLQGEVKALSKQKQKGLVKQQRDDAAYRELEVQFFKISQRLKIKDQDLKGACHQLQNYRNKIRQYEKQLSHFDRKSKSLESNFIEEKTKIIKLQEKQKAMMKEVQNLKIKLLRAKIETIHELRETIN